MKRTNVNELNNSLGKKVLLKGWVSQFRKLTKFSFLILREKTGYAQVFIPKGIFFENLYVESVVEIVGIVKEEKQSQYSGIEVQCEEIRVISKSEVLPFPISRGEMPPFYTLNLFRPLTLRKEKERCLFKIQSEIIWAYREYLRSVGFTEIQSTKLSASGMEGGSEMFEVKFFERNMYLTQSPQFYKQMMVGVYERVFEVGKVYRAEGSSTNRHLAEFVGLDFEMGFIESVEEVMQMEENIFEYIFTHLNKTCKSELEYFNIPELKMVKIPRLTYEECVNLLNKNGYLINGVGFNSELERNLGELILKEYVGSRNSISRFTGMY